MTMSSRSEERLTLSDAGAAVRLRGFAFLCGLLAMIIFPFRLQYQCQGNSSAGLIQAASIPGTNDHLRCLYLLA
jgi:hypothetical protein